MQLDVKKYLHDIKTSCEAIASFARGKSLQNYLEDAMLRSAVERQFMIIGEALNQAEKKDPQIFGAISDGKKIIAFRNILVHGYAKVSNELVWGLVETRLKKLLEQINALLAK